MWLKLNGPNRSVPRRGHQFLLRCRAVSCEVSSSAPAAERAAVHSAATIGRTSSANARPGVPRRRDSALASEPLGWCSQPGPPPRSARGGKPQRGPKRDRAGQESRVTAEAARRFPQVRPTGCSAAWLARLLWEQEAAGSNPAIPTRSEALLGAAKVAREPWLGTIGACSMPGMGRVATDSVFFDHEGAECRDKYHRRCSGRWRGVVSLGADDTGKRIRRKVSGQTKDEVITKLRKLHNDLAKGVRPKAGYTLEQCIRDYLDDQVRRHVDLQEDHLGTIPGDDVGGATLTRMSKARTGTISFEHSAPLSGQVPPSMHWPLARRPDDRQRPSQGIRSEPPRGLRQARQAEGRSEQRRPAEGGLHG